MMIWVSVVGVRDTTCPLQFVAKLVTRGGCEQIDRFLRFVAIFWGCTVDQRVVGLLKPSM